MHTTYRKHDQISVIAVNTMPQIWFISLLLYACMYEYEFMHACYACSVQVHLCTHAHTHTHVNIYNATNSVHKPHVMRMHVCYAYGVYICMHTHTHTQCLKFGS